MQNFSKSTKWSFLSKEKFLSIKNFLLWYIVFLYGQRNKMCDWEDLHTLLLGNIWSKQGKTVTNTPNWVPRIKSVFKGSVLIWCFIEIF